MKGKSLAVFLDAFEEVMPSAGQGWDSYNRGPYYRPIASGLEKLLGHYGVQVKRSYVLDKSCFEQRLPQSYGGGKRSIYYAPLIKDENINSELSVMKNIKALITLKNSPIELETDSLAAAGLRGWTLFSSSEESWEMSGRIDLNPWTMQPPASADEMARRPLAVLVEGEFPSYFAGKAMPEKPSPEETVAGTDTPEGSREKEARAPQAAIRPSMEGISSERAILERGKPGKIFVIGTAAILSNNVIDEEGKSTTATFVMNVLDHLNSRDDYAGMRSKVQQYNPLRDTSAGLKTFIKSLNIAGLPVIVALFGVVVWLRRAARKRSIQMMFRA
jgi:ABC-type uncharacterized transport system involved in gliding motility auxiliary subunit